MPRDRTQVRRIARTAFRALGAAEQPRDLVPGLELETIMQLIQVAAETQGWDCDEPKPSRRTAMLVCDFGKQVKRQLDRWCDAHEDWLAPGVTGEDLYEDEAGYVVLMTLRGEDVGVADGRWDHFFRRGCVPLAMDSLKRALLVGLSRWADPSGGGVLMLAFERDAEECSDDDPVHELEADEKKSEREFARDLRELDDGLDREVRELGDATPKRRR